MESTEEYEVTCTAGNIDEVEDRVALSIAVGNYVRSRKELESAMQEHQLAKENLLRLLPNASFVTEFNWKTYLVSPDPFIVREIDKL